MIIRKFTRQWIWVLTGLCFACSEGGEPEPPDDMDCMESFPIMAEVTATAECGTQTGAITMSVTTGNGSYEYSLDGTNFTSNTTFTGLAPGNYPIIIKDENNCRDTTTVLINSGISFSASVKPIIDTNCAVTGCHVAGQQQIPNFQVTANILNNASSIRTNTSAKIMPPPDSGRSLTDEEIQILACWADDGGPNN
jgi:hypothetical protein